MGGGGGRVDGKKLVEQMNSRTIFFEIKADLNKIGVK